ncbi:hypothetical protein [Flavobacterium terrisoli]|uniref:hypothetical protein n=1 Tax=Flavobacterium terrisoli TaxID=3242195 RepID=UPI002542F4D0|nr:hypothetical protein [Flavobacterium buctense]
MIKRKPYLLLFTEVLVLLSYFIVGNNDDDNFAVNVHDTYFVMSKNDMILFLIVLLSFSGIIYWMMTKFKVAVNMVLANSHIFGTLFLTALLFYFNYQDSLQLFTNVNNIDDLLNPTDYNFYIIITLMLIALLQVLFIINIFVAIIKKLCNSATK